MHRIKEIGYHSNELIEHLDLHKGNWLLFTKDHLQSYNKKFSEQLPDYLFMQFQEWGCYNRWLETGKGIRLFQPNSESTPIIHADPLIGFFPPEEHKGLKLPKSEFLGDTTYNVSRAWVGKDLIVKELIDYNPFYSEIIKPQIS